MADAAGERAPYCVIIPAHNEQETIARTLAKIIEDGATHRHIIVVCNACTDDTAGAARLAAPTAEIIDVAESGKWRALNTGLAAAAPGIAIVVDADVEISGRDLDILADTLTLPGVQAASPGAHFDLGEADEWVKSYYRVFTRHRYLRRGVGGVGVYGLSQAGRDELGPFPPVMSDDGFVRTHISMKQQRRIRRDNFGTRVRSFVRPPRTFSELLQAEVRWRQGDRELKKFGVRYKGRERRMLELAQNSEISYGDVTRYVIVKLLARAVALVKPVHPEREWRKDQSSRNEAVDP